MRSFKKLDKRIGSKSKSCELSASWSKTERNVCLENDKGVMKKAEKEGMREEVLMNTMKK